MDYDLSLNIEVEDSIYVDFEWDADMVWRKKQCSKRTHSMKYGMPSDEAEIRYPRWKKSVEENADKCIDLFLKEKDQSVFEHFGFTREQITSYLSRHAIVNLDNNFRINKWKKLFELTGEEYVKRIILEAIRYGNTTKKTLMKVVKELGIE